MRATTIAGLIIGALIVVFVLGLIPDGTTRVAPVPSTQVVVETPTPAPAPVSGNWTLSMPTGWFDLGASRTFILLIIVGLAAVIARWGLGLNEDRRGGM